MHIWQSFGTMAGLVRRWIKNSIFGPKTLYGKVTFIATLGGALVLCLVFLAFFNTGSTSKVSADSVQTSVTVLNTPPAWTVDAQEANHDSSTSTPTNAGDVVTWTAVGTDSSSDNYWLVICKTGVTTPTPHVNSAPTCAGGPSDTWATSVGTTTGGGTSSGFTATAATTTLATFPFNNEKNDWFGYICDGNAALPQCNSLVKQGVGTPGPSPFFVDHPPAFTNLTQTAPQNPGGSVVWSATATTTDIIRGGDKVILYICKTNSFSNSSTTASCPGGLIAKSATTTINPTATLSLAIPTQDSTYTAFAFLTNNFNLPATTTPYEGSSTPYIVNNVAPTITAGTITLVDPVHSSTTLVLAVPNGQTGPYWVSHIQINDNNSCQNISSGQEIVSLAPNVYRSGIGSSSCLTAGNYNPNNCYPSASTQTNFSCTQDAGSCTVGSVSSTWTCTFSLWYVADPTDVSNTQFFGQHWTADVVATDDQGATSSVTESTATQKDLTSFLAFAVTQTAIGFGGLQPGQQNDPLGNASTTATTTIRELGNTGIDQSIYGDTMCGSWTSPDSCDAINHGDPSKDIPIANQKVGTSSVAYASPFAFALGGSTTPTLVGIHVPKTISTTTPNNKNSFFGINIPSAITFAGAYLGQDTIIAVTSSSTNW